MGKSKNGKEEYQVELDLKAWNEKVSLNSWYYMGIISLTTLLSS